MKDIKSTTPSESKASFSKANSEIEGKYLLFHVADQLLAVPISEVIQIIGLQPITPIPEYPDYMMGIIQLRNKAVPVVNMRKRLRCSDSTEDARSCIVIVMLQGMPFGLLVDQIDEVIYISDRDITDIPWLFGDYSRNYLLGVAKLEERFALILDTSKLLSQDDFEVISENKED